MQSICRHTKSLIKNYLHAETMSYTIVHRRAYLVILFKKTDSIIHKNDSTFLNVASLKSKKKIRRIKAKPCERRTESTSFWPFIYDNKSFQQIRSWMGKKRHNESYNLQFYGILINFFFLHLSFGNFSRTTHYTLIVNLRHWFIHCVSLIDIVDLEDFFYARLLCEQNCYSRNEWRKLQLLIILAFINKICTYEMRVNFQPHTLRINLSKCVHNELNWTYFFHKQMKCN